MSQSQVNWQKVRESFPVCREQAYFYTSAVGVLSEPVYQARQNHLRRMHLEGDIDWQVSVQKLEETRGLIAQILNAPVQDIGIGINTSLNMNFLAMWNKNRIQELSKPNIVVPEEEFPSSTLPWEYHGYELRRVPSQEGFIDIQDILSQIDDQTVAVVHSAVQFATGFRQDLQALGEALNSQFPQVKLVVNATQAFGVMPIDVKKCRISALVASCHKWVGSGYGTSILYMDSQWCAEEPAPVAGWLSQEEPSTMYGIMGPIKKRASVIETGVLPFNSIWGLCAALHQIQEIGLDNIYNRVMALRKNLTEQLENRSLPYLQYLNKGERFQSSIVHIKVSQPETVVEQLARQQIYASARAGGLRVALQFFNNEQDIDRLVSVPF